MTEGRAKTKQDSGTHLIVQAGLSSASNLFYLDAFDAVEHQKHQMSQLWNLPTRLAFSSLICRKGIKWLFLSSWSRKGKFDPNRTRGAIVIPDSGFRRMTEANPPAFAFRLPAFKLSLTASLRVTLQILSRCLLSSLLAFCFSLTLFRERLSHPWVPQNPGVTAW